MGYLEKQYQIPENFEETEPTKQEILDGIRQGVLEMKLVKAGN